jgi:hypothetical protein
MTNLLAGCPHVDEFYFAGGVGGGGIATRGVWIESLSFQASDCPGGLNWAVLLPENTDSRSGLNWAVFVGPEFFIHKDIGRSIGRSTSAPFYSY